MLARGRRQYNKKNEKKLRDMLLVMYGHLGRTDGGQVDEGSVAPGLPGTGEYFPYVTYPINMELIK